MAPILYTRSEMAYLARRAAITFGPAIIKTHLTTRGLTVRGAQGVTLGVIAAYIVLIAILWNIPYVRYVLWPFKVSFPSSAQQSIPSSKRLLTPIKRC